MAERGRPKSKLSLYDRYIKGNEETVKAYCRNGADNRGICKRLGIGLSTFKRIQKENPEFNELLKEGKDEADLKVESALYRRALGYSVEETVTEVKVGEDGSAQTTVVKKVKKHIAGDTTAQIFWLKNRKPNYWRDKQDINVTGDDWVQGLKTLTDSYKNDEGRETKNNK